MPKDIGTRLKRIDSEEKVIEDLLNTLEVKYQVQCTISSRKIANPRINLNTSEFLKIDLNSAETEKKIPRVRAEKHSDRRELREDAEVRKKRLTRYANYPPRSVIKR